MDWRQLWEITTAPDNVPIVIMMVLVPWFLVYGLREAVRNDRLIAQLEADPALAKVHHRRSHPYHPAWDKVVHTWPFLLRVEFLAALIVTAILLVWSVFLDAPLEEPANPTLTMNPAKAPWYFLGLQELLVYFDPWYAGVVLPTLILVGLMAIPYLDTNPLGNGYYTWRQRKSALAVFMFGFVVLWVGLCVVGTFVRGTGWMPFWPGQPWDRHRVIHEVNTHLHQVVGLTSQPAIGIFGAIVVAGFFAGAGGLGDLWLRKRKPALFRGQNLVQYLTTISLLVLMIAVPLKILLKHVFHIKYVWVTPWFNV